MKKTKLADLAIHGATAAFEKTLPVGQLNIPSWDRFETSFNDIFSRQYYTNQGPLVVELEEKLSEFLGVKHVICMVNATIALMIAVKALELKGKVLCPAFTFVATAQSLTWAGLKPVLCDIDPVTHQMSVERAAALIDEDVSAILGVHLWGNPCSPKAFQNLAQQNNIAVYFDAAHAFGCSFSGTPAGNFGSLEVFSFHATKILNAAEGGCVCTNDDELAKKLRNIRSSYGAGEPVKIPITGNGRMSEAQAAMALLSLADYAANRECNKNRFDLYAKRLGDIPGINILSPSESNVSNYQYVVLEVSSKEFGLSRDVLQKILVAENIACRKYFSPGIHRTIPFRDDVPDYETAFPYTDQLCEKVLQLPSGQHVTTDCVNIICDIIDVVYKNSSQLITQ